MPKISTDKGTSRIDWNTRFNQLKQYNDENGHCRVPWKHPQLGKWVSKQRQKYNKTREGNLSSDQIKLLNEIGFEWTGYSKRVSCDVSLTCATDGCMERVYYKSNGNCRKHGRPKCSTVGCTNIVVKGGVCRRHGAPPIKECSHGGCTNKAVVKGVCIRHGAPKLKRCRHQGCNNQVIKGGVCIRHGAIIRKTCKHQGCNNQAIQGGVCIRHGAVVKKGKTCKHEGCTSYAMKGRVCYKHGAKRRTCSHEGCTNNVYAGYTNYCQRHTICAFPGCTAMKAMGYTLGCDLSEHRLSPYCQIGAPASAFCQVIEEAPVLNRDE
jgi:hypothetical protein